MALRVVPEQVEDDSIASFHEAANSRCSGHSEVTLEAPRAAPEQVDTCNPLSIALPPGRPEGGWGLSFCEIH